MNIANCETCRFRDKMKKPRFYGIYFPNGSDASLYIYIYEGYCYVKKKRWYQADLKGPKYYDYYDLIEVIKNKY